MFFHLPLILSIAGLVALGLRVSAQSIPADPLQSVDGGSLQAMIEEMDPILPLAPPPSLRTVPVPVMADLLSLVQDRRAAVQLGKALFWDMQVGSDGRTSCATCHHHAGADSRVKGGLHAGVDGVLTTRENTGVDLLTTLVGTDDVRGSAGVRPMTSQGNRIVPTSGHGSQRQTTGRHSPSVINSIFYVRNFWDGRANEVFNGRSQWGARDAETSTYWNDAGDKLGLRRIWLTNASLASQAVGPVLSSVEMSHAGRSWPQVGRRLLDAVPMVQQRVNPTDSVLGPLTLGVNQQARPTGLSVSYRELVRRAFRPELWNHPRRISVDGQAHGHGSDTPAITGEWDHFELNFSLYFGVSVLLYEATLVSEETPFDRYMDGDEAALTAEQERGMKVFYGKGNCAGCHAGPEFSVATMSSLIRGMESREAARKPSWFVALMQAQENPAPDVDMEVEQVVERELAGTGKVTFYDSGFYNIGVVPSVQDLGVGASDLWGNPLSYTQQYISWLHGGPSQDRFNIAPRYFAFPLSINPSIYPHMSATAAASLPVGVAGAFKVPTLRNIELTGPYFHNGQVASLEEVVAFYNMGGNRTPSQESTLHVDIRPLGLTTVEQAELVAFLKALTDERVRYERAPFDHPSLLLPVDQVRDETGAVASTSRRGMSRDIIRILPSVGAAGASSPLTSYASRVMTGSTR